MHVIDYLMLLYEVR